MQNNIQYTVGKNDRSQYIIFIPFVFVCFLLASYVLLAGQNTFYTAFINDGFTEYFPHATKRNDAAKKINILSENDVSVGLKDTVYTDKDSWLELRIDQQMLYQHFRDGRVFKYPISSGNKYLSRSVESRPGLFAIFHKTEKHESSQYNGAEMYFFMPFNQGIGFHSLNGTGYYGSLGVRPSSHGCIRMRHEDVRKVFKDSPLGTLVLAHNGKTARTVGFAPKEFSTTDSLTKDEEKLLLAENLHNILDGKYFISDRRFFIVNPKTIPVSGVYIGYDAKLPDKQKTLKSIYYFKNQDDRLMTIGSGDILDSVKSAEYLVGMNFDDYVINDRKTDQDLSSAELIKKYFHNPIGILPYFPPEN
ncbi:MAG: L,D-transpeptidase [Ignavibacteria bacterium]